MNINYEVMLLTYKCIIESKTRLVFTNKLINNCYVYNYDNYFISFNINTQIWILIHEYNIVHESFNLDDIINLFLYNTNRLAMVLHTISVDKELDILCNKLSNFHTYD